MVAQSIPAEYLDRPQNGFQYLSFNNPRLGVSETGHDGDRYVNISADSPLVEAAYNHERAINEVIEELARRENEFDVDVVKPAIEGSRSFRLDVLDEVAIHPFMHISDDTDLDFINRNITDRFKETITTVAQKFGMQPRDLYTAIAPFFAYYIQDGKRYIMCLKLK